MQQEKQKIERSITRINEQGKARFSYSLVNHLWKNISICEQGL